MSVLTVIQYSVSLVFLLVVLSYYVVFLFPRAKENGTARKQDITIIVPAHNEQTRIASCLSALANASWPGKKHIIVVDDGSADATATVVRQFPFVTLLAQAHTGKSASINRALARTKTPLVAIVDADSVIAPDSLLACARRFTSPRTGAVCAAIRVQNRHSLVGYWLHLEQLYGSFIRSQLSKIGANIVAAGPLTMFRTDALRAIQGFSTDGYSEDVDIAIRLQRAGWRVEFADKATVETVMPTRPRALVRQRRRFARGWVNIFKKHLRRDRSPITFYALPLALFTYFQAVLMAPILVYTIVADYLKYFVSAGVYISGDVVRFFIEWLSLVGVVHWAIRLFSGAEPWTAAAIVGLASAALSYPLYLVAAIRAEGRLRFIHVLGVCFLFPFWLFIMVVYVLNIDAWFGRTQLNRWHKE